jgi:hypothetical protein
VTTTALTKLNGGWPFGPGPNLWALVLVEQAANEIQPEGIHLACAACGRSITRIGGWSVTLAGLKPQVAAHVMQVHPDAIMG